MKLQDLQKIPGAQIKHQKDTQFSGVATDSRKDTQGQVFVALKGDVHDAHNFVADVVKKGVGAVLVHEWRSEWQELLPLTTWVQVPDTLKALQDLALHWRRQWGKKLLAVTGSNGKTTVKDFTHAILKSSQPTLKNEGSFNNHWGLPLTLLQLRPEHQLAIVEMGMNHGGEIKALCKIAEPDVALVNNVGRAHIENFGSEEGIAKAKEEIYYGLSEEGVGVFNLSTPRTKKMYEEWEEEFSQTFTFGTEDSDVFFVLKSWQMGGLEFSGHIGDVEGQTQVPVWGEQNLSNLMAASALALAAGMSAEKIWQALPECRTGWGRNQWVKLKSGTPLLFDAYNANPDSFSALFTNLEKMPERPQHLIGVFGEMFEQGTSRVSAHENLGRQIAQSPLTEAFFIGASSPEVKRGFESVKSDKKLVISNTYEESLASEIKSVIDPQSLVVIKGSRGGALERVVMSLDPLDFTTKK